MAKERQLTGMSEVATTLPAHKWRQFALTQLAFPVGYALFGGVGVIISLVCLIWSFVLPPRWAQPVGQRLIQRLFAIFVWYIQRTGLAKLDFGDLYKLRSWQGGIIVANHPCLLDVVLLVSHLPNVFCLMKAGLVSNITLCGTARLAGYVQNGAPTKLIKTCVERLGEGGTLLVFPEGTRTIGRGINSFKLGFGLIAKLAQAPVQTVLIETNSGFLGKGWPFFKCPSFPVRYSLKLGERFFIGPDTNPKTFGRSIEEYFRENLTRQESQVDLSP